MNTKTLRKLPAGADLSHIHPDLHRLAVSIGVFLEHPENPRLHPEENKRAIRGSLKRYQQRIPIVANLTPDGLRIEAHHEVYRQMAALGSGYAAVAIMEDDPVTELGFLLTENRTGDLSEDDPVLLAPILRQLINAGEAVEEVGWDEETIRELLGKGDEPPGDPPEPQIGRAAELQKEWGTALGDVWEIPSKTVPGRCHRVLCGDCRKPDDVARLLDGQKVNVAFTSPPYASQRKYDEESGFLPIKPEAYVEWFEAVQANVRAHLAPDGSWFVNIKEHCEGLETSLYVKDLTIAHVRKWGWLFATEFCWERGGMPGEARRRFKNQFEPVFQFALTEWKFNPANVQAASDSVPTYSDENHWAHGLKEAAGSGGKGWKEVKSGLAYPGNRLPPGSTQTEGEHSAAFPVALPTFFIKAYSDQGDIIFDPFLGSGTVIIAAEREGRIGMGSELSPKYVAVILERCKGAGLEPRLL